MCVIAPLSQGDPRPARVRIPPAELRAPTVTWQEISDDALVRNRDAMLRQIDSDLSPRPHDLLDRLGSLLTRGDFTPQLFNDTQAYAYLRKRFLFTAAHASLTT